MDASFIEWLVGQVGLGGLAGLAIWLMDKRNAEHEKALTQLYTDKEKRLLELLDDSKQREAVLIETLRGNTQALTAVKEAMEDVKDVVGKCGIQTTTARGR